MNDIIDKMLLNFFCIKRRQVGDSGIFLKLVLVHALVAVAVPSDSSGREIFFCSLAPIAFLSHTLLFQPHSSLQTRGNRSVISFLLSFLFFFSRLFILIIFISLPGAPASLPSLPSLHRLYRAYVLFVV